MSRTVALLQRGLWMDDATKNATYDAVCQERDTLRDDVTFLVRQARAREVAYEALQAELATTKRERNMYMIAAETLVRGPQQLTNEQIEYGIKVVAARIEKEHRIRRAKVAATLERRKEQK